MRNQESNLRPKRNEPDRLDHSRLQIFYALTFLANFQLIVATNPFPCGWLNDLQIACGCAPVVITKYQKRISGPLLDRIDIPIEVPRVDYEKLSGDRMGETSESIRKRVQAARNIQQQRFAGS